MIFLWIWCCFQFFLNCLVQPNQVIYFLFHIIFIINQALNLSNSQLVLCMLLKYCSLKAHRQISEKRCFRKYCSCDQACQFSALQGTPWRSYLEKLTIDDKFINKRVRLFIHQTTCREEKIICTSSQGCKIASYLFKKMCKQPLEEQKQSPEVFYKKSVFKNFLNLTGKNLCWSLF